MKAAPRFVPAVFLAAALAAACAEPARATTPCEAPAEYTRAASPATPDAARPLLRPYLIGGLPAVSLREQGDERWLQLAVHSADEARRALAGRERAGGEPTVAAWRDRVWMRCPAQARAIGPTASR